MRLGGRERGLVLEGNWVAISFGEVAVLLMGNMPLGMRLAGTFLCSLMKYLY